MKKSSAALSRIAKSPRNSGTLESKWLKSWQGTLTAGLMFALGCSAVDAPLNSSVGDAQQIAQRSAAIFGKDGARTVVGTNQVLNSYSAVTADIAVGAKTININNIADLPGIGAGDLIMIIQMQGAEINTTNTDAYGTVVNLNGAGTYEFVNITGVAGNTLQIDACGTGTKNAYRTAAKTQVVRVPQYTSLTIPNATSVTAAPWDGAKGGVVAIHATTLTAIEGSIDVTGKGFRGGAVDNDTLGPPGTDKYLSNLSTDGGEKGESIAGDGVIYTARGGKYGRGAPANGGGGGVGHNSAGGGGANASNGALWRKGQGVMDPNTVGANAFKLDPGYIGNGNKFTTDGGGGRGGYSFGSMNLDALTKNPGDAGWGGDSRREVGGLGGRPIDRNVQTALFLGGGGGAGDGNNSAAGAGGAGGGLVYLTSATVSGAGKIVADGAAGGNTTGTFNDAAGGAGGGGTVVVVAANLSGISISANGGKGGDQLITNDESEGPGGGGGGGFIATVGGAVTRTASGGKSGKTMSSAVTEFPVNGATDGNVGRADASALPLVGNFPAGACPSGNADLAVTITDNQAGSVTPGGTITYTVTVTNRSGQTVNNINLADTLPAGVVAGGVNWTCSPPAGGTCPANGTGPIGTSMISLPAGASAVYTVTVPVPAAAMGFFNYSASVNPPAGITDPNLLNNAATDSKAVAATTLPATGSDLSIKISHTPASVQPGQDVTYTAQVINNGPDTVNGTQVVLALPPGAVIKQPAQGNGWTCVVSAPSTYTCNNPTLTVGMANPITAIITAPASPPSGGLPTSGTVTAVKNTDPNPGNNSDKDVATVPSADLSVTVSDNLNGGNATPGQPVTYTVVVNNYGQNPVTGATLADQLGGSAMLGAWTCTASGGATCPAQSGSGSIGGKVDVPVGGSLIYTITTAPIPDTGTNPLDYRVTITNPAGLADPNLGNNSSGSSHPVNQSSIPATAADLSVTLTHSGQKLLPGTDVTYTAQVVNNGPGSVAGAVVTFSVPQGSIIKTPASGASPWTCVQAGTDARCVAAMLQPGSAPPINVVITVPNDPPATGTPQGIANVTAAGNTDPVPANNTSVDVGSLPEADLSLTITRSPGQPKPGDEVTYTLVASNVGPDAATSPTVVFTVPPGGTIVQPASGPQWQCTQNGATFTCVMPTLGQGDAPPITVVVKLPATTPGADPSAVPALVGQVGAPSVTDPNPVNNRAISDAATAPRTASDLEIDITRDPATAVPGQVVTYTVQATNKGPDTVNSPSVTFTVPAGMVIVQSAMGDGWSCQQSGSTVTCLRSTLDAGAAPPITMKLVTPVSPAGTSGTPSGGVSGVIDAVRNDDPVPANNTDSVSAGIPAPTSADLALTLTRSPATTNAGQEVTFTLNVENKGQGDANNVTVAISIPPDTIVTQPAMGDGWTCYPSGQAYLCTRPQVTVGNAPPITLKVTTPTPWSTQDPQLGATVTASDNTDPVLDNNTVRTPISGAVYKLAGGGFGCSVGAGSIAGPSAWMGMFAAGMLLSLRRRRRVAR